MPSPVRYPNGVTNVSNNNPLRDFIANDPTKLIQYFNDFHTYTASEWLVTETDAAATQAVNTGARGGILDLTMDTTTATAALQLQLGATAAVNETFKIQSGKKLWLKARFALTAGTMNNFGALIGLAVTDASAVAGVTDGFYFRKSTGSSALEMVLEKDSTESTVTMIAAPGTVTATYYECAAYYNGKDSVEVWLDGVKVGTHTTLTNLCDDEELAVTIASVNATAGAANVLSVDYILVATER